MERSFAHLKEPKTNLANHIGELNGYLTPKGSRPCFGPFLKFGQAIVNAIFVQKISNFW
jgi:hypothetical protein